NQFDITEKDYKIVFFYDSGCGHCKKAAPVLMEAFDELQNANISADVISMNLSEDREEWRKFIEEYNIQGKVLGDIKGISNAGYYYYIDSTPQIYVLDKDNKIIAKKIAAEYVDDFIRDYIDQL
ncbi:MAG: TlpA disulfide reductase family protein, partial [Cyclobacteriaceae bacterium]